MSETWGLVSSLACGTAWRGERQGRKATLNMEQRKAVKIFLSYIFLSLFS